MRRLRNQTTGLPVWWVEVLMLAVLYYSYTGTRSFADASAADAIRLGHDLLRLETWLHIDIELSLNRWVQSVPVVAVLCCYYYGTLHFVVTPSLLIWTHRRNIGNYSQIRWTLVVTTLISLLGFFLFPTAPPRLLPGEPFTDTMAHFEAWGWWTGTASAAPQGLEGITNQFAALPSLHCAWALWCGFLLFRYGRRRITRVLGLLYPAATVFVVMSTANHYLLDAAAGWAVLGFSAGLVALALVLVLARRRASRTAASSGPSAASSADSVTSAKGSDGTTQVDGAVLSDGTATSKGTATSGAAAVSGEGSDAESEASIAKQPDGAPVR
ncbi:phosphatase PAP2 family protein [Candidatus Frankia nodulisporulans]|uniref:phosphatase PAP2 family protein n=1 Tax=Candidatus Frankia nodulisporulans TaxID=2060052 RepID=UPI0013CF814B|nr:phosphatase PAP2 family protein [Candidatus Frankia nodulisporulans]